MTVTISASMLSLCNQSFLPRPSVNHSSLVKIKYKATSHSEELFYDDEQG